MIVSVAVAGLLGHDFWVLARGILLPVTIVSLLAFWGAKLYPGVALGSAEELRRCAAVTTRAYIAGIFLLAVSAIHESALILLLPWSLTLISVPLMRSALRSRCSHKSWWGYSALVLVRCPRGRDLVRSLQKNPGIGIKPVAVLAGESIAHQFFAFSKQVLSHNVAAIAPFAVAISRNLPAGSIRGKEFPRSIAVDL